MLPIDLQNRVQSMRLSGVDCRYRRYTVKQGTKRRQIEEPDNELKALQQELLPYFDTFPLRSCCMAAVGKGCLVNATKHRHAKWMLRVDIKGCYQAITKQHLEVALANYPDLLELLDICVCTDRRTRSEILPTGAATSPILCNIALTTIDIEMLKIAEEFKLTYTRYLDDMTFSSVFQTYPPKEIFARAIKILRSHGYEINQRKSRWFHTKNDSIVVTGVRLGHYKGITQTMRRSLRSQLFKAAVNHLDIDKHTLGQLGYVKKVDRYLYNKLLAYYEERKSRYVAPQRACPSSQQTLSSN